MDESQFYQPVVPNHYYSQASSEAWYQSAPQMAPAHVAPAPVYKEEYYAPAEGSTGGWYAQEAVSPPPKKQSVSADEFYRVDHLGKRWPRTQSRKKSLQSDIEEEISGQNLYKTELCRSYEETGTCRYGAKCQFAHGKSELRPVLRHPKYKTEVCKTFHTIGTCPYGKRCRFIHTPPPADNKPATPSPHQSAPARPRDTVYRAGWSNQWPQQSAPQSGGYVRGRAPHHQNVYVQQEQRQPTSSTPHYPHVQDQYVIAAGYNNTMMSQQIQHQPVQPHRAHSPPQQTQLQQQAQPQQPQGQQHQAHMQHQPTQRSPPRGQVPHMYSPRVQQPDQTAELADMMDSRLHISSPVALVTNAPTLLNVGIPDDAQKELETEENDEDVSSKRLSIFAKFSI